MATILLALGDLALRAAVRAQLRSAGQATVLVRRPLEVLDLATKLRWDVILVDASPLGRAASQASALDSPSRAPIIGLGLRTEGLASSLDLPLQAETLISLVASLASGAVPQASPPALLSLDPVRRLATAKGLSVALTRIEFRLLQLLVARQPHHVSLIEVLDTVWGSSEGRGTSALVRSHVRNLRLKLTGISLGDAVRARRGLGYAFVASSTAPVAEAPNPIPALLPRRRRVPPTPSSAFIVQMLE